MDSRNSHLLSPSEHDGVEVKVAAGYTETNNTRLNEIAGTRPKVAEYLRKLIAAMEKARAEGESLDPLATKAVRNIQEKLEDGDLKDYALEVISDTYQGLMQAAPAPAAPVGPRPMAVTQEAADNDPCATFPDGGKDVESIFAHLNDVASFVVPPFGTSALTNRESPERMACVAAGLSEQWFSLRSDARYVQLMQEVRDGTKKVFDKGADWDEGGQRWFANFFSKNSDLLPPRVKNLRENMPRARGPVQINDRFMGTSIPESQEVVAFSLLCHFSNLLQNGSPQAKAAAFSLVVDRHRREIGVNIRTVDEAELARQQGRGREMERGMAAVGADQGAACPEDDFGCAVNQFVGQANQAPPENDMGGALNILRQFQVDVTNQIDVHIGEVKEIHQKIVDLIGANAGQRHQLAWTLLEPLLSETHEDADIAKTKMFNSIAALLSAAQRGHSMPALRWLQSRFSSKNQYIIEKHGTMEAYVKVEVDQMGVGIKVSEASVRVNIANPPAIYSAFAPHQEYFEFARTRAKEQRSRMMEERIGMAARIKNEVDAAAPGEVVATFLRLVNSPQVAEVIRKNAQRFTRRSTFTAPVEVFRVLLEQFENQEISAEVFADSLQSIKPYKKLTLEYSIKELLRQATEGEKRQNIQDARDKIGELIRKMGEEGGGRISVKDVFILKRYLNAQIVEKLKINRLKPADVHSEIIKIARRLFLA